MEHAKKMILVPSDTVDRLQQPSVSSDPLEKSHNELSQILRSRSLSDAEKWSRYQQILTRCLHFAQQRRNPLTFVIDEPSSSPPQVIQNPVQHAPNAEEGEEGGPYDENQRLQRELQQIFRAGLPPPVAGETQQQGSHPDVLAMVPQTYRPKASLLLQTLEKTGLINWDERGKVRFGTQTIAGSNIVDLVNDAVRKRKTSQKPAGHVLFYKALAKTNIPRELIGNTDRWNLIRSFAPAEGRGPFSASPSSSLDASWPVKKTVKAPKRLSAPSPKLKKTKRKLEWESFKFKK